MVWFPCVVFGSIATPSHFELHCGVSLAIAPVFKDRVYKELSLGKLVTKNNKINKINKNGAYFNLFRGFVDFC